MLVWGIWPFVWNADPQTIPEFRATGLFTMASICLMICASAIFVWRPTRWLAVPMVVVSFLMTTVFVLGVRRGIRFFHGHCDYPYPLAIRETFLAAWGQVCLAFLFFGLTSVWSFICFRPPWHVSQT